MAAWITAATTARPPAGVSPLLVTEVPVQLAKSSGEVVTLTEEVARLRDRLGKTPVRQESVRNPFALRERTGMMDELLTRDQQFESFAGDIPTSDVSLDLVLAGVAFETKNSDDDRAATAIVTSPVGEVYLVTVGDLLPGGYRVVAVSASDVTLVDIDGKTHLLALS